MAPNAPGPNSRAMEKRNFLIDMDGVLVSGHTAIPGAADFIQRLIAGEYKFLVVTNNPLYTPGDLSYKLRSRGLDIPMDRIYTSAMATAHFLQKQKKRGTAFVIGESGLTTALHNAGFVITDQNPEYVVVGETTNYSFDLIAKAIRLVAAGSNFIATNPDANGPAEEGIVPACGAMAALIEKAGGHRPYFIGKPNPLMMRSALNYLGVHSENTCMIGDRMDTDVIAGIESGMETILVLSGVTNRDDSLRFPYQPSHIVGSVAEIEL
ncbi:MAG: haloacid dehalogenase [Candidatus Hydrogenedentota bacterium]